MDINLLIEKYLSDKLHLVTESDSVNVSEGSIFRWDFANIPAPTPEELQALEPVVAAEQQAKADQAAKIQAGRKAREVCQSVLDLIAGHNLDRELTLEQITQMQQAFGLAEQALRAGRPTLAKNAINALQPDGVLITAAMKQEALDLLSEY